MNTRSILSTDDYTEYLIRLCFGPTLGDDATDYLRACVSLGYLEMRQVVPDGAAREDLDALQHHAEALIRSRLEDLRQGWSGGRNQDAFDAWHRSLCLDLIDLFGQQGRQGLGVGLAQQWINLALKHIYVLGEGRVSGFAQLYPLCHVPLDAAIVEQLNERYGCPQLSRSWELLDDYDEYFAYQQCIRRGFTLVPLDVELLLWLDRPEDAQRLV